MHDNSQLNYMETIHQTTKTTVSLSFITSNKKQLPPIRSSLPYFYNYGILFNLDCLNSFDTSVTNCNGNVFLQTNTDRMQKSVNIILEKMVTFMNL